MPDTSFIPDPPQAQFIPDPPAPQQDAQPQFIPDPVPTQAASAAAPAGDGMDFSAFQSFLNEHAKDPNHPGWRDYLRGTLNEPAHMAEGLLNLPKAAGEAAEELRQHGPNSEQAAGTMLQAAMLTMGTGPGKGGHDIGFARPAEAGAAEVPKVAPEAPTAPQFIPDEPSTVPAGHIRFYHGTVYPDATGFTGDTFVTPHYPYARDYHGGQGTAADGSIIPNNVLYTDLSHADADARGLIDEVNRYPIHGPINDGASILKPMRSELPSPTNSAVPPVPDSWKTGEPPPTSPPATPAEAPGPIKQAADVVRAVFSPDTISPEAEAAAGDIRAAGSRAARDTETTRAAFDEVQNLTSKLTDDQKIELNDYIERRSKGAEIPDPALQAVADAQREAVQLRRDKIEAMDSTSQAQFREDYLTHMYKDPNAAVKAFTGPAKEGSGRFLKERTIPTLKEAMARGLEPITLDPLEMTQKYVETMDRFIATREVIDQWKADGTAEFHPPGEQPPGWVEINTRQSGSNMPLYAPADVARVYNNFISRGFHSNVEAGKVYDAVRSTSNAITSLKLGLSGFHAATMAKEAYASGISKAVAEMASGKPLKAAISVLTAPAKFVTNALRGREVKNVYLGKTEGTPEMRQIVALLTEGGGRMVGNRHAADYRYSAMDSYWNAFKRGSMKAELQAAKSDAMKAYGLGSIKVLAQQVGRTMQTVAKPLFEHYIPSLKNGAAYDAMSSWLEVNPTADHATQVKAARKIVDSIDNRFGEMIQDNVFWNKTLKQSAQVSMLSYSWFLGTAREIAGGTAQLARNPARLSMKHPDWKPGANYALALPFVVATANAVYQYLKTGKSPESVQDLMAPETGGTIAGAGGKGKVAERAQTPGYEKDVFGWLHSPKDEAFNKLSGIIQIPYALARNKDWKDQPIRHEGAPALEQVGQVFKYIANEMKPISLGKLNEGQPKGSNISKPEVALGIKNAPAYLQAPEGSAKTSKYFADKDWRKRLNWERNHARKMQ